MHFYVLCLLNMAVFLLRDLDKNHGRHKGSRRLMAQGPPDIHENWKEQTNKINHAKSARAEMQTILEICGCSFPIAPRDFEAPWGGHQEWTGNISHT